MKIKTLLLLVMLLVASVSFALSAELVLVVNKDNPASSLSAKTAQDVFLGKKTTWEDGSKIHLVTQKNPEIHEFFTNFFVEKTPQQYSIYWKKSLFTGKALPPALVNGDAEVKETVSKDKAAIGYISKSALDSSVKALAVN